uniref:Uncharacterized protein LOC105129510 isoform X5 n=1 Tax=Rhizophora mucronata TaxID=61149 RepID=A0A2P2K4P5_RHIMU
MRSTDCTLNQWKPHLWTNYIIQWIFSVGTHRRKFQIQSFSNMSIVTAVLLLLARLKPELFFSFFWLVCFGMVYCNVLVSVPLLSYYYYYYYYYTLPCKSRIPKNNIHRLLFHVKRI